MEKSKNIGLMSAGLDWWTILIYIALVLFGWINIYAAVYNDDHRSIFDLSQSYGKQIVWMGICLCLAVAILLIEDKYYHMFAYPFYYTGLVVMTLVMLFGTEVNGARAWIDVGSVRIQPVEFMKFVTALALAKFMSSYNFNIKEWKGLYYIGLIIGAPVVLILLQNDTGSAMVFTAFVIMLYREGFGKLLYILGLLLAFLFIISFLMEPFPIIFIVMLLCIAGEGVVNGNWSKSFRYLGIVLLLTLLLGLIFHVTEVDIDPSYTMIIAIILSLPFVVLYSFNRRLSNVWVFIGVFVGAVLFTEVVDYVFDNILQTHQQKRILDLLGLEKDPRGASYNVIQSKIAIGSGGINGKGFLEGTQTKFSFVPEQSTDFIFCTIGEEWGFLGSAMVVILFVILILRIMKMGERQKEPFARVYCYCVAAIIFMHFTINITMTIGLFPVVGIPLPFFSYGGSSLLAFTILLFVAIRLDSNQYEESGRKLL